MLIGIIIAIFIIGYACIAFEHVIKINKAATALLTGGILWTVYILFAPETHIVNEQLAHHLGELAGILFFLLGAMTIVELIDAHDGFDVITEKIKQTDKRKLLWIVSFITFFLSALLDNLTTTIVMVSLLRKLVKDEKDRLFFAGVIVIAANAGGAWSPIGDVTTTMLWIEGQITTTTVISNLFFPSLICMITPLIVLSFVLKGKVDKQIQLEGSSKSISTSHQLIVLISGLLILVLVPVFKTLTHLPPYLGILIGLGILWVITEVLNGSKDEEDKHTLSVVHALRKIDTPSILFFFGILVAIAALQSTGILADLAVWMKETIVYENLIVFSLGILSSIVDNVPLVAAAQGMYDLSVYPQDHPFWIFLAYCTGTGGSMLIIGSAAGVAAMGMEKISFIWYLKRISLLAFLGYIAGAGIFILQQYIFR